MEAWAQDWLGLLLRWAHRVTGIAWIGASFYFNWLENQLERRAYAAWLTGFCLLMVVYWWNAPLFLLNPENSSLSVPMAIGLSFAVLLVSWLLYDGRCRSPQAVCLMAKRGFCPSCGARRMAETAALLADDVFPDAPLRQWVISFPFPLRFLFAAHPQAMGKVLGIV